MILPAEDLSEVSLKYKIAAVPTFLLLRNGNILERVDGANAADLTTKVKTQVRLYPGAHKYHFENIAPLFKTVIIHNLLLNTHGVLIELEEVPCIKLFP